jgi:hypothetical protein
MNLLPVSLALLALLTSCQTPTHPAPTPPPINIKSVVGCDPAIGPGALRAANAKDLNIFFETARPNDPWSVARLVIDAGPSVKGWLRPTAGASREYGVKLRPNRRIELDLSVSTDGTELLVDWYQTKGLFGMWSDSGAWPAVALGATRDPAKGVTDARVVSHAQNVSRVQMTAQNIPIEFYLADHN